MQVLVLGGEMLDVVVKKIDHMKTLIVVAVVDEVAVIVAWW